MLSNFCSGVMGSESIGAIGSCILFPQVAASCPCLDDKDILGISLCCFSPHAHTVNTKFTNRQTDSCRIYVSHQTDLLDTDLRL